MLDEVVPADRQFDDPIIREGRLARPTVGHTSEATVLVEHELTFCGEEDGTTVRGIVIGDRGRQAARREGCLDPHDTVVIRQFEQTVHRLDHCPIKARQVDDLRERTQSLPGRADFA